MVPARLVVGSLVQLVGSSTASELLTVLPVLYPMFALEKVQQIKSLWSNPDQPPLGFVSFLTSLCVYEWFACRLICIPHGYPVTKEDRRGGQTP